MSKHSLSLLLVRLFLCSTILASFAPVPLAAKVDIERLKREHAGNPKANWWMTRDIGIALFAEQRYSEAIEYLRTTVGEFSRRNEDSRMRAWHYWYLGEALRRIGRDQEATVSLESGLTEPNAGSIHEHIRRDLTSAYLHLGDAELDTGRTRTAATFYRKAQSLKSPVETVQMETALRLYAVPTGPEADQPVDALMRGTVIFCAVRETPVGPTFKRRARMDALLFRTFVRRTTSGRVQIQLTFHDFGCHLKRFVSHGGSTFPVLESATDRTRLERAIQDTFDDTDFYVFVNAGYAGGRNSASYGYRFLVGEREIGKSRIDLAGTSTLAWIHEFHHAVATLYWPVLGQAHRFQKRGKPSLREKPSACHPKDANCLGSWPSFLRGSTEPEFYAGLYATLHEYASWKRLADLSHFFASYPGLVSHR